MESGEVEALVERLVANPHDSEALARAHREGEADPQGYAYLLELVGTRTEDASYASHWLSEAANIWSVTLGDAHRAARVLMIAVDRDPTQPLAADRLAQLYRDKGDVKALVAMLDRRVRLLTPMLGDASELRGLVASLHEELGRLWNEPPLSQPRKAIEHYRRSIELDPSSAFAIFSVREIYKSLQQWDEAVSMYGMELAVEQDPERRLLLRRDEAATRKLAGDLSGATAVLRAALTELRDAGTDDPGLAQETASSMLDRREQGSPLDPQECEYGADLLVGLAESFQGEHGIAYAGGALDLFPGHDRAMQLYAYFASSSGQADDLSIRYHAYVEANPEGTLAAEARQLLSASYESAGQVDQAIQVLLPLRGHPDVDARLDALRSQAPGNAIPTPVGGVEAVGRSGVGMSPSDPGEYEAPRHPPPQHRQSALEAAQASLVRGDKSAALEHYLLALEADPGEPEALSWVEDQLRSKRDYAKLRDVLAASARAMSSQDSIETRKLRLREIAGLSESNLKDLDGAVAAWRQVLALDRGDDGARSSLTRLLEKGQRWDDLAMLYEQDASTNPDIEEKIQLEKKLAALHEQKRTDPLASAEAWSRIADLTPEDDQAVATAATLFERAGRLELAAQVIETHTDGIDDKVAKAALLERLGTIFLRAGDHAAAGQAFERAAETESKLDRWTSAERAFVEAKRWPMAAQAAERGGDLGEAGSRAEALARASEYFFEGGDPEAGIARLERARELAPESDEYATKLAERYRAAGEAGKLAVFLTSWGASLADVERRTLAFREAARTYESPLNDPASARAQWERVLEAGEDAEALGQLAEIALGAGQTGEAAAFLRRLGALATNTGDKTRVALREADLLLQSGDAQAAVDRYEWILETLDPACRQALRAIADIEDRRGAPAAAAAALERELGQDPPLDERRLIAHRLATTYEAMGDLTNTFKSLERVRAADPDDFDVLARLVSLADTLERWEDLERLLEQQIDIEADAQDISLLTRRRASILADKLGRGDDALAALLELADGDDPAVREAYVALGDRLGWRGIVATKLVEWWFPQAASGARIAALVGAFQRFALVGRDDDAVKVGAEIIRTERDATLAQQLEELATKTGNLDALTAAQEILGADLSGTARATELVRQAESRSKAGMPWAEAVEHGETGLGGVSPEDVEPLLLRLAALINEASAVVDLYERQVSRSRGTEARQKALGRAAHMAGKWGLHDRARTFFDLALTGTPSDEAVDALERSAREADGPETTVRRTLAAALASGAEGTRDGGRSKAAFLRRAASIARNDLGDVDQAFVWLGDALVAHVDVASLDALTSLAEEVADPRRAEDVLGRALGEVFDGPLVRLLLARRAQLRREKLDDRPGAAQDLKKLHDLSPNDEAIMVELSTLLIELGDHRSLVKLYEDQILRSKDQGTRAELARKVADEWEGQLGDPREAADAWRRVLRLKPGDPDATAGLERAKSGMLRRVDSSQSVMQAAASEPSRPASGPSSPHAAAPASSPQAGAPVSAPVSSPQAGAAGFSSPHAGAPAAPASVPATQRTSPASAAPPPPPTTPSARPSARPSSLPVRLAVPAAPPSVEELDESELDLEPMLPEGTPEGGVEVGPEDATTGEHVVDEGDLAADDDFMSTDPFGSPDATHTSIDARPLRSSGKQQIAAAIPPSSRRTSKPPPLPPSSGGRTPSSYPSTFETNDPPTAPGRRLDATGATLLGIPSPISGNERSLSMTEEHSPFDFSEETISGDLEPFSAGAPPPTEGGPVTAADPMTHDEASEEVLVVDDFVEDIDDEQFEDVAEPSKPHGHPS